jgi:hypothetical protein
MAKKDGSEAIQVQAESVPMGARPAPVASLRIRFVPTKALKDFNCVPRPSNRVLPQSAPQPLPNRRSQHNMVRAATTPSALEFLAHLWRDCGFWQFEQHCRKSDWSF